MVTLSTVFCVAFPQDSEKKGLLWPFLPLTAVFWWQTDCAGGKRYLFLTVFIHRILAFLKGAIHIHWWPPGLRKAAEGSFISH